jgi:hypothetical protein
MNKLPQQQLTASAGSASCYCCSADRSDLRLVSLETLWSSSNDGPNQRHSGRYIILPWGSPQPPPVFTQLAQLCSLESWEDISSWFRWKMIERWHSGTYTRADKTATSPQHKQLIIISKDWCSILQSPLSKVHCDTWRNTIFIQTARTQLTL